MSSKRDRSILPGIRRFNSRHALSEHLAHAVEKLLDLKSRVVIVDPLGVWWGLRLEADGRKQSPYDVVIFGGPHGDLPLTEHAGALIGETAATMTESCIVDLSELGTKAAERRQLPSLRQGSRRIGDARFEVLALLTS